MSRYWRRREKEEEEKCEVGLKERKAGKKKRMIGKYRKRREKEGEER